MSQFQVGDVKISRIVESEGPWDGTFLLPNATGENVQKEGEWLYPAFADEGGKLRMSIHSIVIESQGKSIIVDTCIGNDKVRSNPAWNKLQLPYLEDLQKLGYTREAIDVAKQATPVSVRLTQPMDGDPSLGSVVAVRPDEYQTQDVVGELVLADANELAVRRIGDQAGEVVVHFPRLGYTMKSAA